MTKEDTVFSNGNDLDHQSQFQKMDILSTNGVDCELGQLIDLAESYKRLIWLLAKMYLIK